MRRAVDGNPTQTSVHGGPGGGFFKKHLGYDYLVKNVPVKAPVAGTVKPTGWSNDLGNWIELAGDDGRTHRLAHLSRKDVQSGRVAEGQQLGVSGNTGNVVGANGGYHLHHDARKAGTAWNASFDNYVDWEKLLAEANAPKPQPTPGHRYAYLVGKKIKLMPKNGSWSAYKEGTDQKVGDVMKVPGADGEYTVRGVSVRPNRVLVNSAALGQGISLPLASAAGVEYTDEWKVI